MFDLWWFNLGAIAVVIRTMVGVWGYSGEHHAPMFGDAEAQRHWMEITVSLPIGDWYRNTPDNDLQYWGLDYPPLTAYVSFVCGKIAQILCPELVELFTSRGHESVDGKTFLRATVIVMDIFILIPAVIMACKRVTSTGSETHKRSQQSLTNFCYCLSCLLLPGLLLIDHGHFQYNGVCLGLALLGALCILGGRDVVGSVFFCLSLNFKQMSLYYAPVFFCCLLRKCFEKDSAVSAMLGVAKLGITVVATFAALWFPFCVHASAEDTCASSLLQVLHRQFPFARGIFEDKVANLWYSFSVAVDFRALLTTQQLVGCSLGLTLLLLAPVCTDLLTRRLSTQRMLLALMNGSLAFFLASYQVNETFHCWCCLSADLPILQVHEKSVLLSLFPACFLVLADPLFVVWFQLLGTFTMFPLLRRDLLAMPYVSCCGLYVCSVLLGAEEDGGESQNSSTGRSAAWVWARRIFVTVSLLGASQS